MFYRSPPRPLAGDRTHSKLIHFKTQSFINLNFTRHRLSFSHGAKFFTIIRTIITITSFSLIFVSFTFFPSSIF